MERQQVLRKLYHPASISLPITVVSQALNLPPPRTQQTSKIRRGTVGTIPYIQNSTYSCITILGKTYTKEDLLERDLKTSKKLLSELGFAKLHSMTRPQTLELLWKIKDEEHLKEMASRLEGKGSKVSSNIVGKVLPMFDLYRSHFASIDRLDAFLAEAEVSLKHRKWRSRLLERIIMLALNNVRVIIMEQSSRGRVVAHPFKKASSFLDACI